MNVSMPAVGSSPATSGSTTFAYDTHDQVLSQTVCHLSIHLTPSDNIAAVRALGLDSYNEGRQTNQTLNASGPIANYAFDAYGLENVRTKLNVIYLLDVIV